METPNEPNNEVPVGPTPSSDTNRSTLAVDRDHTWSKCIFMTTGLSMCITVDILQYSMPLAFLPSILEDRGHSPIKIATAIGIYYWTGFLGGLIITSYQIWRMLYEKQHLDRSEFTSYTTVCRHIKYLIIGLGIGTLTLFLQALYPTWLVHTSCRFVQGFCGAFIFFYTFLLSVALFKNQQQVVAMTFASCALNVAEVFGSFLGAVLYEFWGQRSVFWFLGVVSLINQILLIKILYMVPSMEINDDSYPLMLSHRQSSRNLEKVSDAPRTESKPLAEARVCGCFPPAQPGAVKRFLSTLESRPLACANILIFTAAIIKGSMEEMLPFHADHRWGMNPLQIGELFCSIAIAYILAATCVGHFWNQLGGMQVQVCFSAMWLLLLGMCAWTVFAVVSYSRNHTALTLSLIGYGVCLGMTHTPAALLLASVIEEEEGIAKDAVNGIWNTMWEAGGSLGFLLGGLLAERYHEQMGLLTMYAIAAAVGCLFMVAIASWPNDGCGCLNKKRKEAV